MKTSLHRPILGVVALMLVANTAAAQVTARTRAPLLEFHGVKRTTVLAPGSTIFYASEALLVYRDGWAFDSSVMSPLPASEPFVAHIVEGTSPAAFQALGEALAANHVGIQSGNCDIEAGGSYEIELTWYSRLNRSNVLKVGDAFRPVICSDAVKNIFRAVADYSATLRPPG